MKQHKDEFDAFKVNNSLKTSEKAISTTRMKQVKDSELKIPKRPISMFTDGERQG